MCLKDWVWGMEDDNTRLNPSDQEKPGRAGTSSCPGQYWKGLRACCEAGEPTLVSKAAWCFREMSLLQKSGVQTVDLRAQQPVLKEAAQWQGLSVTSEC